MLEDKVADELLRNEISKKTSKKCFFRYANINLLDRWVKTNEDLPPSDPTTKIVKTLNMYIRYVPSEKKFFNTKSFGIYSMLFSESRVLVNDWAELIEKSKQQDEEGLVIAWMLRNTNLCEDLFKMAVVNLGCIIPISFDILAYGKKLCGEDYMEKLFLATPEQILGDLAYTEMRQEAWEDMNRKRALDNYYKKKENKRK